MERGWFLTGREGKTNKGPKKESKEDDHGNQQSLRK
jgi:hypothetical protein